MIVKIRKKSKKWKFFKWLKRHLKPSNIPEIQKIDEDMESLGLKMKKLENQLKD